MGKYEMPTHYSTDPEFYDVFDEDYWVAEGERLSSQWNSSDEEECYEDQLEWYGSND